MCIGRRIGWRRGRPPAKRRETAPFAHNPLPAWLTRMKILTDGRLYSRLVPRPAPGTGRPGERRLSSFSSVRQSVFRGKTEQRRRPPTFGSTTPR